MRRLIPPALVVLMVASVGVAGYLGFRGVEVADEVPSTEPPTVRVTRGDVRKTVLAPGQTVGTRETVLGIRAGGRLMDIGVRSGDVVRRGDVLARLDPAPLEHALAKARLRLAQAGFEHEHQLAEAQLALQIAEARLSQALTHSAAISATQAALVAAQAELHELLEGPSENDITPARAELATAEAALRQAQAAYDQVSWRSDAVAQRLALELESATNTYAAAKARVDILLGGADQASIARAQARVRQAQAEVDQVLSEQSAARLEAEIREAEIERAGIALERLQRGVDPLLTLEVESAKRDLDAASLRAPFDSVVLEVLAMEGQALSPGAEVVLLADPVAIEVRATVIEEDVPLVRAGQPVELFFDAHPDASVSGRVVRMVPQRVQGENRPLYYVYVAPDEIPRGVVAGMTADASITIAQRPNVLRLPRALVRARSDGSAQVKMWADAEVESRTVKVGLRGDVYIEVLEGLTEGEQVVGE